MRRDPRGTRTLQPIDDPDLTAHALGRLDPAVRERVERAVAADPTIAARRAVIAAHLARYEAVEAPPPPPFSTIAARLDGAEQLRPAAPRLVRVAAVAAAVLLIAWAVRTLVPPAAPGPALRAGEGLRMTEGGVWVADQEPAEGWIGDRVHVVLDADARLAATSGAEVRLIAGRALFEVTPDSRPFRVTTAHGDVRVLGTVFEVAVDASSLFVAVATGRVQAAGSTLAAGEALQDGHVVTSPHAVGAFYRRPILTLSVTGALVAEEAVTLGFTFKNPGRVPFALAGPDGVRAALWLEIVDPAGHVHDVAVPGVDAPDGPLPPGDPLHLAGRGERSFTARLGRPLGDRGTYRCRALYRPEGQPSVVSDALLLEVR